MAFVTEFVAWGHAFMAGLKSREHRIYIEPYNVKIKYGDVVSWENSWLIYFKSTLIYII